MNEPIRMVFFSSFTFFILLIVIFFWRFIYPKKKLNFFILLLFFSLLPIISIFRSGDYESGDFNIHIYRTITFYNAIKEGIIMPSWGGDLNATYGYPLFIFLNPLPYYLTSLFHILGFSFINSMKLFLASSFIASSLFFYLWAKKETKNSLAAFFGTIIYLFTPYHLVDLHFRTALGENAFFAFLPLFFYSFFNFKEKNNLTWFLASSLAFSLLIFSHQAMAVFSLFIIIPYFFYSAYKKIFFWKKIVDYFSVIILGFIYSLYTWMPHLLYTKYTHASLLAQQTVSFLELHELLYSPWRFGFLFQGPYGELSYLIGYTQVLLLVICLYTLIIKKTNKTLHNALLFWFVLIFFIIFMITPFSAFIWNNIPILNTAQFSSRLLLILTFALSAIGMNTTIYYKKKYLAIYLFIILTVGYTVLNWGHRKVIPNINDTTLILNLPISTATAEGLTYMGSPRWIDIRHPWKTEIPKNNLENISGNSEITLITRRNNYHQYIIYSNSKVFLKENTYYFPGWKLFIDDKPTQIQTTNKKDPGLIYFSAPKGVHKIELIYKDLPNLFIAKIISVSTISFSLILIIMLNKKFRHKFHNKVYLFISHSRKKRKR